MANDLIGFDPDTFRTNIVNTMVMGLPVPVDMRPTFYFPSVAVYPDGTLMDSEGKPIDPRIKPTRTAPPALQVPCAAEYETDTTNDTDLVGTFWSTRATITVLDDQYVLIKDATEVDLSKRRYLIQELVSYGLGPVTVYQLICFRKGVETSA